MLTRREFTATLVAIPVAAALPASAIAQARYPTKAV
jgi:hypothetical protein